MNLAAILPRFPYFAFQPQRADAQVRKQNALERTTAFAQPELRTMPRNALMRLENKPLQLCVLRGCVWITRDGCPVDIVLGAGEIFEQRPGEPVLVQALEEAELSIAAAGAGIQNA